MRLATVSLSRPDAAIVNAIFAIDIRTTESSVIATSTSTSEKPLRAAFRPTFGAHGGKYESKESSYQITLTRPARLMRTRRL